MTHLGVQPLPTCVLATLVVTLAELCYTFRRRKVNGCGGGRDARSLTRETLAAHTVAGKGLMQQKDGVYYVCPEKGVARMEW